MQSSSLKRPDGLSGFAGQVFDVLARYTMFPWAVMKTQCERAGVDPYSLSAATLRRELLDNMTAGITRFTSQAKGARARADLEELLVPPARSHPDSRPPR
ncbi:MAG: hypothetical protein U1A78_16085 [Polyangia bacterium]